MRGRKWKPSLQALMQGVWGWLSSFLKFCGRVLDLFVYHCDTACAHCGTISGVQHRRQDRCFPTPPRPAPRSPF